MASESSQAVVLPKFDMHVYTLILSSQELKEAITEYCIPVDLHPHLPHPGLTMNKLPPKYTGLLNNSNKEDRRFAYTGGYQLGRQYDIDLCDNFPTHYNENDVARLAEFVVPLRPPPRHLLYVCRLTAACRHPELAYNIKDSDGNVITMDTFLKLLVWIGTVSKGDHIPEDQCPKLRTTPTLAVGEPIPEKSPFQKNLEKPNSNIVVAREKKDQQNLAKAQAKHAEPATVALNDTVGNVVNLEKEVFYLSGNADVTTPPATVNQPSPRAEHKDTTENTASDVYSFHLAHHEDTEEDITDRRFMLNWGLRDDLRICTFRACKELVSHLATPSEEEFLGNFSNVEVTNIGLTKELTLLDNVHSSCSEWEKELVDNLRDMEKERDDWRKTASEQVKRIRGLEEALVPQSKQLAASEERFIPAMVKRLHTSVEYRKSLAAPVSLCFTAGGLSGLSLGRTEDQ
ncbi:hypothetical protein Tco_1387330, partial [Tanacetum coccineum]